MIRCLMVVSAFVMVAHVVMCDDAAREVAKGRFFHVSVEGAPMDTSADDPRTRRLDGKAFAVAPKVLITAGHVVEDMGFWKNKGAPGGVAIPDREVTVSWMEDYGAGEEPRSSSDFYVTSSTIDTVDAASLTFTQSVPTKWEPFELNTGEIDSGDRYRALLSIGAPGDADSIDEPAFVTLKPVRHSDLFSGMYVFAPTETHREIQGGDADLRCWMTIIKWWG